MHALRHFKLMVISLLHELLTDMREHAVQSRGILHCLPSFLDKGCCCIILVIMSCPHFSNKAYLAYLSRRLWNACITYNMRNSQRHVMAPKIHEKQSCTCIRCFKNGLIGLGSCIPMMECHDIGRHNYGMSLGSMIPYGGVRDFHQLSRSSCQ
jgi:hypothetical protein